MLLAVGLALADRPSNPSGPVRADDAVATHTDEAVALDLAPAKDALPRLDGILNGIVAQLGDRSPSSGSAAESNRSAAAIAPVAEGERVAVSIATLDDNPEVSAHIASLGGTVANTGPGYIEAYVPVGALASLSDLSAIGSVRAILPPRPLVTSQGAAVHGSPAWNAAGFTGAGVKVGIIDVGFIGYSSLIGSELTAPAAVRCYTAIGVFTAAISDCESGFVHGTAVTEAVVDVSPGVTLYIANPMSRADLMATTTWMASEGVQVINQSVSWSWEGPGDGTTPYSNAALAAVAIAETNGILWVNAAGNANGETYSAPFSSPDGDLYHNFSALDEGNTMALTAGQQIFVQMRWEGAWGGAATDLGLYLVDSQTSLIVAGSQGIQDGSATSVPFEAFAYTVPATQNYHLLVYLWAGAAPAWLDMQDFYGEPLEWPTPSHSISNPAESASPSLLAVGAVPHSSTATIESFSSLGPTRDGRIKPDITGANRGDSATYGPGAFGGTSQASPHVAGLAALAMDRYPSLDAAEVADFLKDNALERGAAGPDNTFGAGFAFLPAPLTVTVNQAAGQSDPTGASPINFTVVFSEDVTGFASDDVVIAGSAGATTTSVTGGPGAYNVAISGMTSNGTVIASVPARSALNAGGEPNLASTSTDNTVTYTGFLCAGIVATMVGTSGPDTINGTPGNDVIAALGGNDTVHGLGGNDTICGDDGADKLFGDDGRDKLYGGAGGDTIDGGVGDDRLFGNIGADKLSGAGGNDILNGNEGTDTLEGGTGNDALDGGPANDVLVGGSGDDGMTCGTGTDTANGGLGTDTAAASCETVTGVP